MRASISSVVVMSLVARAATASITVDNPGRTKCPETAIVNRAVVTQIGGEATVGGDGWHLSYWPKGDGIQLDLRDAQGGQHLHREIPGGADDCQARADAIALILGRFFESLGWTAGRPLPPPEENVPATAASASPARRSPFAVAVEAGGGLWTRRQNVPTGVAGVRVVWGSLEVGLHLLGPGEEIRQPLSNAGDVRLSAWGLALSPAVGWEKGRIRLRGGPVGIVSGEWARSERIPTTSQAMRTTLAVGLAAGCWLALSPRWRLDLEGWGTVSTLAGRFVVAGWGPVLAPPRVQATAFAAIGYAF